MVTCWVHSDPQLANSATKENGFRRKPPTHRGVAVSSSRSTASSCQLSHARHRCGTVPQGEQTLQANYGRSERFEVDTSLHEFWCTKRAKRRLAGGKSCKSSSVPSWVPQTPNPLNPTNPKRYIETPHPITSGVLGVGGWPDSCFK